MKVLIIRHAEVDFCWSKRCTSNMFDSDCREYDNSLIIGSMYKIPLLGYQRIYISELSRTRDTAEILFPDCDYIASELINEVPLRSSFDTKKKMPLWFWNASGRIQWFMNSDRQIEGHSKTAERARQFVEMISKENTDCAVVEQPIEAAAREIYEETSVKAGHIVPLTSMAYISANVISKKHRDLWSHDTIVIPEYTYGFECGSKIVLSREHNGFEWLTYDEAITRLTWDSNKTALYELNCRLLEACQIGGLEGKPC